MTWLAIHLDFGLQLVASPAAARAVGEIFVRPCFAALNRMSARRKDRWSRHQAPSESGIAGYLTDPSCDALSLDTKRGQEVVATAEVENGVRQRITAASVAAAAVIAASVAAAARAGDRHARSST